jgi:amino acid adenylation domain-containing protein
MTTARFDADLATARLQAESSGAVYSGAPAPPPRTLWQILEATAETFPRAAAIDDGRSVLDYLDLLEEARRAGDRLASVGIGAGDRVGICIASGTAELYLSILAVLSVGAAYVPVDADDPDERAELVWSRAGVCAIVSGAGQLTWREVRPTGAGARRPVPEDDAWIIFTSGTTGTPKGVAVAHRSAAALVDAEARLFLRGDPLGPGDRVLAGLSVAFDASCEEMWLAWRHGACLIPAPRSVVKTGPELVTWLAQRRVSVISTVPTLASLWPGGSPDGVRLLVLGGEVCPRALADRLAGHGAEVWNTYGPTEATVVSCAARLSGGEPVRIGLPLDGWRLAVVDPASGQPVSWGQVGELVIGGVGVASYLDPDRDAVDFRPLQALGWERAYHTGDLVRAGQAGLIYLGRADAQVKIRGYRIEPSEIEAVLMQLPGIGLAAVTTYEPQPGIVELAGYYTLRDHAVLDRQAMYEHLRNRLPRHMVPAYLEELPAMPLLPDGKADRKHLPAPASSGRLMAGRAYVAPATPGEKALAGALADLLGLEQVSVDSQFFNDLGLSSLLVAHFCARARERAESPPVSVKDIYLHPTIRCLAAAVTGPPAVPSRAASPPEPRDARRASTAQYMMCGALQLLAFLASVFLAAVILTRGFTWLSASSGAADLYLRSLAFGGGIFFLACSLPILAKWTLVGRWKPREISVWSLRYLRFWLVKTLVQTDPLALFTGSPVYPLYLRALGARIGRRVVIFSRTVPVCTDMLTIGDDTVIRRESSFTGYRAVAGVIQTGPVSIGKEALIGEHTVLDIGTSVGDRSQLGHTSSLHQSQAVPDGQRWHGSPAQRTDADYRRADPIRSGPLRRAAYGTAEMLSLIFVDIPLAIGAAVLVLTRVPAVVSFAAPGAGEFTKELLPGRADPVHRPVRRRDRDRGRRGGDGPACPAPAHHPRPHLPAVRLAPLGAPRHPAAHQRRVLPRTDRRQLLRRALPARPGLPAARLRADRVELRRGPGARDPVPDRHRARHDGRRRRHLHRRRLLQHIVPHHAAVNRAPQLPGKRGRLPGRSPDRRELPDRHQGHGAPGRAGPGPHRAARLAMLRDSPVGHHRRSLRPPQDREGVPPPAPGQEPAQPRHHGTVPGRALGTRLRHHLVRHGGVGALPRPRSPGALRADRRDTAVQPRVLHHGRAGPDAVRNPAATVLLHLPPVLLVARTLLETAGTPARPVQRHPVQEPGLAPGRRPDRPAGLRRRLRHPRADARDDRRPLHAQRRLGHPVPLDGRRHLQGRLHHPGRRLHPRHRSPRPLRRDHGPGRTTPARLLPDEGREGATPRTLGRQPRPADVMTPTRPGDTRHCASPRRPP